MLWATVIWEHIRAIPGALERMTLEALFESIGEIFSDPEFVLFAIVCLLLLWALIAIAKLCLGVVDELVARRSRPGGLGLN